MAKEIAYNIKQYHISRIKDCIFNFSFLNIIEKNYKELFQRQQQKEEMNGIL